MGPPADARDGFPIFEIAACDVGLGLFAARAIDAGEPILRFEGPALTLEQVRSKGPLAGNTLQVERDRYVDLREPGRLVNHSCSPNAGLHDDVILVAVRRIALSEEIRFDYSTTIGDRWTMRCACHSPACRGIVAAYSQLPDEVRRRYEAQGIVQRFLLSW
jgi:SET domain-containing protein